LKSTSNFTGFASLVFGFLLDVAVEVERRGSTGAAGVVKLGAGPLFGSYSVADDVLQKRRSLHLKRAQILLIFDEDFYDGIFRHDTGKLGSQGCGRGCVRCPLQAS
jgi:hypothetical protein